MKAVIWILALVGIAMPCTGCVLNDEAKEISFDRNIAQAVVRDIEEGRLAADPQQLKINAGLVYLPKQFSSAALQGQIRVTHLHDGTLFVYFPTMGCRGSDTGYLYCNRSLLGKSKVHIYCGSITMSDYPVGKKIDNHWWYVHTECGET